MSDNHREVKWQPLNKGYQWRDAAKHEFVWLYGAAHNELLLHHTANTLLADATIEQLNRATHWAPGPNPHYDVIYLPFPPKED